MDAPQQPIIVNPNPTIEILFIALRQLGLVASGLIAIVGFLSTRDLVGLVGFVRSAEFYPFLAAAVSGGLALYGWVRALWNKRKLVVLAAHADDAIGQIKGAEPALPPIEAEQVPAAPEIDWGPN